ncbi:hypothetical protein DSECCO2_463960 [anaerobic digester metagenome]
MRRRVSITRCPDYEPYRVEDAFAACLAPLGGIEAFARRGSRVLVKPNLLASRPPDAAVTTHPSVVRAAIRALQSAGTDVVVGDSPGGRNTPERFAALLRRTGLAPVLEECGCEAVFFDEASTELPSPSGRVYRRFRVARAVTEAEAVVSLSKCKTHQLTLCTGAVKNCYGYIPGVAKAEYHLHSGQDPRRFASLLLDLYQARPPVLSVMDAIVGMEGNGPSNGRPRALGLLLASPHAPDLDFVQAMLLGIDPLAVPTVQEAADRGVGPGTVEEIEFLGDPFGELRGADFERPGAHLSSRVPAPLIRAASRFFAVRPRVEEDRCRGCGACVESCPPGAIEFSGRYPRIRYQDCIRCFCCQELCPADAIALDRPFLRRLIG